MRKVSILTSFLSKEEVKEKSTNILGFFDDNRLIYCENNIDVIWDLEKHKIIRKNEEYIIEIDLENRCCIYNLTNVGKLTFNLENVEYINKNNQIFLGYDLVQEGKTINQIVYKISFEVIE